MDDMDFKQRVALYRNFDQARQRDLEEISDQLLNLTDRLTNLQADLEDEQSTRRTWRKRAEDAENSINRNQFVLVLIDGDGYYFKEALLRDASEGGGNRAAYQIYSEVQNHLQINDLAAGSDIQVMVNVYANRSGLARFLCDTEMLQNLNQLDQFFASFTQSQSLFQFIDCGYGKERADSKFRDTYRFYAYNAQCKYIFLACCHDNGYVAELDKYRHDPIAAPKTILVQATSTARQYSSLQFPIARFDSVFENTVPQMARKQPSPRALSPSPQASNDAASQASTEAIVSAAPPQAQTWSSIMTSNSQPSSTKIQVRPASQEPEPKGIPINRAGQRIDLKLRQPTQKELDDFEVRIAGRKLCNRHHLSRDCPVTKNCKFDHDPITPSMMNTLRLKARSIPCTQGQYCRQADCFYGHQCPWGKGGCANSKCAFVKADMHNIGDTEVAKLVPPEY